MKKRILMPALFLILLTFGQCKKEIEKLNDTEIEAVLFMLEEEKLARDTYDFLAQTWSLSQFENIKKSEQSHMDALANLLEKNDVAYTILPIGEFANVNLQNYYNQFVIDGSISAADALQIGATIEDLDIVDLGNFMNETTNSDLLAVYEKLQCGSRNHIRSFVSSIENAGQTYSPIFLTVADYNAILSSSSEQCGK